MHKHIIAAVVCAGLGFARSGSAQGFSTASSKPRPWSRVSFFTNSSIFSPDDGPRRTYSEMTTAFSYQFPESDDDGSEFGADVRMSTYASRPDRVSVYEGFIGARVKRGAVRMRAGHVWLSELGSLGSLAGGVFEVRQRRAATTDARWRLGAFGGLDPNVLEIGYAPNVKKFGGYAAYDGSGTRRHSVGYAMVRNGGLTERSVVMTTNMIPIGQKVFVYQAAEYNVQPPAGLARKGLAYFFANARVTPGRRLELQGTYNRGRAVDARGLGDDVLNGRPITQLAVDGLLFESVGGRLTVEALPRVRVYAGYSRDKNNRDTAATGRTLVGGYASNVAGTGLDVSASDSLMHRPTGSYHSRYVSVGRQVGRNTYLSADYSTSLSVVRFSRSDGITIETRPHTTRCSGTGTINLRRSVSLLATMERTNDDQGHETRIMAGLTYRIR